MSSSTGNALSQLTERPSDDIAAMGHVAVWSTSRAPYGCLSQLQGASCLSPTAVPGRTLSLTCIVIFLIPRGCRVQHFSHGRQSKNETYDFKERNRN